MASKNYQDLMAWQEAMNLVVLIHKLSRCFPKEELFCLGSQSRRGVVSIPSNIAEGQGRRTAKEFFRFLSIAHGSLREVETQVLIARRLDYIDQATTRSAMEQAGLVGRLITGLANSLRKRGT